MSDQFVMNCSRCGAKQSYSPGQQTLKCEYCSSETEIPKSTEDLPAEISSVNVVVPLTVDKTMLESATQGYMVTGEYTPDNLIEKAVITKQWLHYVPVYLYVGSYEARWTATFGYDREEHYTEYVTKYENGRSYKVPETKTKTVTDWRPANGSDAGNFATHAYAGAKLPQKAIELIEKMHMGDNKPQIFKQEFIAGIDVEEFTSNDDDVYSSRAQAKVNAIIDVKVKSHAQGDRQKDWHWTAQIDKKSLSALVPIAHSIFEYEGKEYNVWIDGSDPSQLVGDTLPVDENKKSAVTAGYIPLGVGVAAAIVSIWGFDAPMDGQFWVTTIASLGLGYLYYYLRKEQIISYSKALRNAYLNRKQADSADTSMMSAEDKDKMTMKFVKPSLPLFADTGKDKFVIPGATLLTFLLAIAPGYLFYQSKKPKEIAPVAYSTPFGKVTIVNGKELLINGNKLSPPVTGDWGLSIPWKSDLKNGYALLVMNNSGGTACPVQYRFVILNSGGYKVSNEFGTCSDLAKAAVLNDLPAVTMPELRTGNQKTFVFDGVSISTNSQNDQQQNSEPVSQGQRTQTLSPKAQDLFNQADYAFRNREYDKALTLLQVASSLDPNNQTILNAIDKVKNEQRAAINSMQIR